MMPLMSALVSPLGSSSGLKGFCILCGLYPLTSSMISVQEKKETLE